MAKPLAVTDGRFRLALQQEEHKLGGDVEAVDTCAVAFRVGFCDGRTMGCVAIHRLV
jgi:hypothetical protein